LIIPISPNQHIRMIIVQLFYQINAVFVSIDANFILFHTVFIFILLF